VPSAAQHLLKSKFSYDGSGGFDRESWIVANCGNPWVKLTERRVEGVQED
jgi:hypothetical protein